MTKYGVLGMAWWGTGIALPTTHPVRTTPGTPSRHPAPRYGYGYCSPRAKYGCGLKSVAQLSLDAQFSGFQGITEVYNLVRIDRINNHFVISQKK